MLAQVVIGLLTGLSLIVAIGAQNAFVLRQGLTSRHVGLVVTICITGDVLLILAGVAGLGALVATHAGVLAVLRVAGGAYLLWFGIRSLLAARTPTGMTGSGDGATVRVVALTALALTFLNPHVYLDTVLMLGTLANRAGGTGRWWFAGGAVLASVLWFTGLGFGARRASRWVSRPRVWQLIDLTIGLVMIALATLLVLPLFG
ncbi:LysE family transporter [Nakamurella sp. A5-74]|uniref:LysE family transporter n=1 Tax=Nakamurella sp. A5-74 TaxID=3158264 RepID=A0AAU8DMB7_9ACTN